MANSERDYFELKGKRAEQVLYELAAKTFLTDWCYLNPRLPDGKELCDLLVVFNDVAIIWQVKDLKVREDGKPKQAEVEKNLRQIAGARRQLFELRRAVELENPRRGREMLDVASIRDVFLVSALLGEEVEFFSAVEDFKNLTIHVFDAEFTRLVLKELDTVSDFVEYLRAKERLLDKNKSLIVVGGEQELLAFYLMNDKSFTRLDEADHVVIEKGSWAHLQGKPAYKAKKKADEVSYGWDSIIERAHEGSRQYELVARELARPNRFQRRYLSKVFLEAWGQAHKDTIRDMYRRVLVIDGATYCFLFADDAGPRERRRAMLGALCLVARGKFQSNKRVLGIATEKRIRPTCSYDFCLLEIDEWLPTHQEQMEALQKAAGILVNPEFDRTYEEEYPKDD